MSQTIANILEIPEHTARKLSMKLEELCGYAGEDNRLFSEIKTLSKHKINQLGLDPDDIDPKELYYSLHARFESDNIKFSQLFGNYSHLDNYQTTDSLLNLLKVMDTYPEVWGIKKLVAESLIKAHSPKKLMRHLNYRSLDSMLKREDISSIIAGALVSESLDWKNKFYNLHRNLDSSKFEVRTLEIKVVSSPRWKAVNLKYTNNLAPMGIIVLKPEASDLQKNLLANYLALLKAIHETFSQNLLILHNQTRADFSDWLAKYLKQKPAKSIQKYPTATWADILHHYWEYTVDGGYLFDDHLYNLKIKSLKPSHHLTKLNPSFKWWYGSDILGINFDSNPVSLNILDILHNFSFKNKYSEKTHQNLKTAFWRELLSRYLLHAPVEEKIFNQKINNINLGIERNAEINVSKIS